MDLGKKVSLCTSMYFHVFLKSILYFYVFLKSNSFVHKGFTSLGNNNNGLKEEIFYDLPTFVLELYQPKRPSNINKYFTPIKLVFIF